MLLSTQQFAAVFLQSLPHLLALISSLAMSALEVAGVEVRVPKADNGAGSAQLVKLCEQFQIGEQVCKHFVEVLRLNSLEDFAHLFAGEDEVSSLIQKVGLAEEVAPLQISRVRRAWQAIKDAVGEAAKLKAKEADDPDLDALLPKPDLDKAWSNFWKRYHQAIPVSVGPSDQLLSRLLRELHLRLLSVRPICKVQTQMHQITNDKPKDHQQGSSHDGAAEGPKSVARYLHKLRTLCLAYAIAGARLLPNVAAKDEFRTSDPTDFVEAPLDTLMGYFFRAEERTLRVVELNPAEALNWLTLRDEAERAKWVGLYKQSGLPLGKVVKQLFNERESLWLVDAEELKRAKSSPAINQNRLQTGQKRPAQQSDSKTVAALSNGLAICEDWNMGRCREPCPHQMEHVCNRCCRNGRACGMRNHRSKDCKNKKRIH